MKDCSSRLTLLTLLLFTAVFAANAAQLEGHTGSAAAPDLAWQSSWLNLKEPRGFRKGDKLSIKVEGNAETVLVRLLPTQSAPDSPDGIEGRTRKVPADRIILVVLERDHLNVKQISVHAGRNAWNTPLGGNNGTVRVVGVSRID